MSNTQEEKPKAVRFSDSPTMQRALTQMFSCDCTDYDTCGPCSRGIDEAEHQREYGRDL